MRTVVLPGRRRVEFRETPDPTPGHGQVVLAVRASGLCGSDLRVIYRREPGEETPYVDGRAAGHEPAGEVVAVGAGVGSVQVGDRVAVYHVAGCGRCRECRRGAQVACGSPDRQAYGYHRDGGHAPYLLAEERSLVHLPGALSFADGALAACGFGTAYQALRRAGVDAADRVLVTGLGPLGLAVAMLASAFGADVDGVDPNPRRRELATARLGVTAVEAEPSGEFSVVVECSGSAAARALALRAAARRARVVFLGEGGEVRFEPSPSLIRKELTVLGSWVCDVDAMTGLLEFAAARGVRPERIVTHRFSRDEAAAAYALFDGGDTGKVIIE